MDLWRTVAVLFRRWYITIPAFVATLGLTAAAYSVVPLQYQSGSVLVLTTPLRGGTESTQPSQPNAATNPLTNFDQSLALTASIVIQQLSSAETASQLGIRPGDTTSYTVNNGSSNPELLQSGPFIFVTGTGPTPQAAQDITRKVSAMATRVLASRQDELKAPASTHIELQQVVTPTSGQPLLGSPMRVAAAAGALAGLATLAAVYGFESLMNHRRRRRTTWRQDDAPDHPAPGPARAGSPAPPGPADSLHLVDVAPASER
ncbi:MAG TPA: hypothetical protein VFT70_01840 [Nocardioides sp.]|nr:hypothetical protein [Nocardioides sp.]